MTTRLQISSPGYVSYRCEQVTKLWLSKYLLSWSSLTELTRVFNPIIVMLAQQQQLYHKAKVHLHTSISVPTLTSEHTPVEKSEGTWKALNLMRPEGDKTRCTLSMTCLRCCKVLASVHDIRVPHAQQYLKCNRVSQGKNISFISLLPLPVCFATVNAIFLSCLFR